MKEPIFPPKIIPTTAPFGSSGPNLEAIDVPIRGFPRQGHASVIGGILGRAAFTPKAIRDASAASEPVGTLILPRSGLLADAPWKKLNVERPTIVMSVTTDRPGVLNSVGPTIIYNYGKIPDTNANAQVSEKGGVCFLSNAGTWWLKYVPIEPEDSSDLFCLLFDASHPEIAGKFSRQPGVNRVFQFNTVINSVAGSTSISLGGRYCRAVTFQNVPTSTGTSANLRWDIDKPANYLNSGAAWNGVGFQLLVGGAVTLQGDALARGTLHVSLEAAGASALEMIHYLDSP